MSWRIIVITRRAKLDLQLGYMVVRSEEITKVALNEISMVLIESTAVSITTSLLAELAKRKVKVIFCDEIIMEVMIPAIRCANRLHGSRAPRRRCGQRL